MKKAVFAAFVGACLLTNPALAQGADETTDAPGVETPSELKIALARQIVDQGFPEDQREAIFFGSVDQLTAQMREASLRGFEIEDEGAIAVMDQWLAEYVADSKIVLRRYIPRLMDGMALSYANIFSEQELTDIAAFVATPSGQRFMLLSSAVVAEPNFAAVNQEYINEIQAGLPAAMQDLQGRMIQYLNDKEATGAQSES
mgnify:CR=1 FL=1